MSRSRSGPANGATSATTATMGTARLSTLITPPTTTWASSQPVERSRSGHDRITPGVTPAMGPRSSSLAPVTMTARTAGTGRGGHQSRQRPGHRHAPRDGVAVIGDFVDEHPDRVGQHHIRGQQCAAEDQEGPRR